MDFRIILSRKFRKLLGDETYYLLRRKWKLCLAWFVVCYVIYFRLIQLICRRKSAALHMFPKDPAVCTGAFHYQSKVSSFSSVKHRQPVCGGGMEMLRRMGQGKWTEREDVTTKQRRMFDEKLANLRHTEHGFAKHPYREDGKCGYNIQYSDGCGSNGGDPSAWCDYTSDKPCCSNFKSGVCVRGDKCTSPDSVNLAKLIHPELSVWNVADKRCKLQAFGQDEACAVLRNKNIKTIGFVGNSVVKIVYSVFLQFLANNFYNGSMIPCLPMSLQERCVNELQIADKYCQLLGVARSNFELPAPGICHGQSDSFVYYRNMWHGGPGSGRELLQHAMELESGENTYLIVGIGAEDSYSATWVTNIFLKPAFEHLRHHPWPKILWIHPMKAGVFKPPLRTKLHGYDEDLATFVDAVDKFCMQYNVPTLDLRTLSTGIWSLDGTHYGVDVNKQIVQFLFNILAASKSVWER